MGYHATHRRRTNRLGEGLRLFYKQGFGEEAQNSGYGKYVWILQKKLPKPPLKVLKMAMDFWNISKTQAKEEIAPPKIVDHAGAWESDQFAYEVWDSLKPTGYSTPDGAVVLDTHDAINKRWIIGPYTAQEYYEMYDKTLKGSSIKRLSVELQRLASKIEMDRDE